MRQRSKRNLRDRNRSLAVFFRRSPRTAAKIGLMAALYPHVPEAQITSPPNIRIRAVKLAFCVPAANLSSGLAKHTRCPNKQSCARAPALSQISPCGRRQPFLARKTHTMPAQTIPAHATRCRKLFHASADNPSSRAKHTRCLRKLYRACHSLSQISPCERGQPFRARKKNGGASCEAPLIACFCPPQPQGKSQTTPAAARTISQ